MRIVSVSPVTVTPRPLNARLWILIAKEDANTITRDERHELDAICHALEQDNERNDR